MKKAGKSIALILAILIVFTLYNSLYTVQPKQYVAVRQFGRIVNVVDSPGLKMKLPFVQTAEAQKAARIAEAEGQVARFNAMYEQYAQNPLITKQRMFYEALESILPDLKVIITDGSTQTMLPLESFTAEASAD